MSCKKCAKNGRKTPCRKCRVCPDETFWRDLSVSLREVYEPGSISDDLRKGFVKMLQTDHITSQKRLRNEANDYVVSLLLP